jgi:hypothetical protein
MPSHSRGKYAVLFILLLALAMAAFAWSWNFGQSQRCLDLYGGTAAMLIRTAQKVEILEIASASDEESPSPEIVDIAGVPVRIARHIDISKAPGLIHARTALVDDASFNWNEESTPAADPGRTLVRFAAGNEETLLYFNFANHRLMVLPDGDSAQLVPKASEGWRSFIKRNTDVANAK